MTTAPVHTSHIAGTTKPAATTVAPSITADIATQAATVWPWLRGGATGGRYAVSRSCGAPCGDVSAMRMPFVGLAED